MGRKRKAVVLGARIDGCVVCASHRAKSAGYTVIRKRLLHRTVWEQHHGPIPAGMCVCHHCDHPACVNIEHLFLGTVADNLADRDAKGRQAQGERNGRAKLTVRDLSLISQMLQQGDTQTKIAALFGVDQTLISKIIYGKAWKHGNPIYKSENLFKESVSVA